MFDVVIFGGGVVGTAIFSKLTRLGKYCCLVEKENDVGFGSSKANSGLVHAGFDPKPGTLKAILNVRGNILFDKIAKDLDIPFVRNGHLVCGHDEMQVKMLYERGKQNGVKGLKILNSAEIHKLEPNLNEDINVALYAPSGGMVSSYDLPIAFAEDGIVNGSEVTLNFDTKEIKKTGFYTIISKDGRKLQANTLINACGAGFNEISALIGAEKYDFVFKRGEYIILDRSEEGFVKRTVFPLPEKGSKGVLITPTVHGNTMVGPTSYESTIETDTTRDGIAEVKEKSTRISSRIPFGRAIRVFAGVRNIVGDDFIIEKSKKIENVINVAGICSPGLSASPAIAEYVAKLLGLDPEKEKKNIKKRPKYRRLTDLSIEELNEEIAKNRDIGKIVCRCEDISLYEIKQALTRPLPANSVDGIKRRVRAGMGRCQGGFCLARVMEEIKHAKKCEYEDILKDKEGTNIIISSIERGTL